jgi:hypothetical protein
MGVGCVCERRGNIRDTLMGVSSCIADSRVCNCALCFDQRLSDALPARAVKVGRGEVRIGGVDLDSISIWLDPALVLFHQDPRASD